MLNLLWGLLPAHHESNLHWSTLKELEAPIWLLLLKYLFPFFLKTANFTVLGMQKSRHFYSYLWNKCFSIPCYFYHSFGNAAWLMRAQSVAGFFHYASNLCDLNYLIFSWFFSCFFLGFFSCFFFVFFPHFFFLGFFLFFLLVFSYLFFLTYFFLTHLLLTYFIIIKVFLCVEIIYSLSGLKLAAWVLCRIVFVLLSFLFPHVSSASSFLHCQVLAVVSVALPCRRMLTDAFQCKEVLSRSKLNKRSG